MLLGFSAYSLPVFLAAYGIRRLLDREKHKVYLVGSILFIFSASLMSSLMLSTFNLMTEKGPGGNIGYIISKLLINYLSLLGAYICALSLFLSSLILLIPASLTSLSFRKDKPKTRAEQKRPERRSLKKIFYKGRRAQAEPMSP
jgi:hypothetical protein